MVLGQSKWTLAWMDLAGKNSGQLRFGVQLRPVFLIPVDLVARLVSCSRTKIFHKLEGFMNSISGQVGFYGQYYNCTRVT